MSEPKKPLFELGHIVATPGALDVLEQFEVRPVSLLARHIYGDWGDVPPEDAKENEFSISHNLRILSAYNLGDGVKVWIITEADRSSTTILLPSEY